MSLKLILGNSGSGKTEYIYEQVVRMAEANPRQNFLVLVPEQFTMQTQRKLVDLSTNHAIMNIDVLSFKRLAYRVFDEMGIGSLQILEETGKNLVLRKVAQSKNSDLVALKANMHRMGYISEMKSLISELMQYNITPDELKEKLESDVISPVLKGKLKDVHTMYEGFLDYLKGHYITGEELLHVLSDLAPESKILRNSVLVMDEFTGFTPVQVELLRTLMPICSEIWASLTIDEKEDFFHSKGMHELFDMPKKTIRVLMDLAAQTNTQVLEPVVIHGGEKKRFKDAPALFFMEQNLFRSSYQRFQEKTEDIGIYSLKNPKEELTWAARKINYLVQEKGYRYRDIAVVSGDVEGYASYVEQVCTKYQIPYFLDTTKDVLFHPFIEFVRAILEVVSSDYSYNALMRLLRTGYCGIEEKEIDKLENYLLATGIRGRKMWNSRWLRLPKNNKAYDLESLEQTRQQVINDFEPVYQAFKGETKEESVCLRTQLEAIYTYIVGLDVQSQLMHRAKELTEEGQQAKAKEYEQIYRIVMDLFDKCIHLLGDERVSVQELGEILDSGFEAAQVAVIPPSYDSVTIGDIERTRLNHVKVLIFLGVNEGVVPKSVNKSGIISQFERDTLEQADFTLAPGAREQAFIQKFYLYLNMTKPSNQLYLTYSRVDAEGKALRPSYLIRVIRRMFPENKVIEIEDLEKELDLSTIEAAIDYFLSSENLEEKSEEWYALAKCFLESEDEKIKAKGQAILDAFYYRYQHDPISHVVAEAIYGKQIQGSVTRLEKYARCAYSHFLTYGLKLYEREESGFESMDMGNLYHTAIESYSKKLAESDYDWFTVPEHVQNALATTAMEEAVLGYPNLTIYATAENAHQVARMQHIFLQTIWALTTQIRKGKFVPEDFEIAFSKADHLDALAFELENKNSIQLQGRIDRLDTCIDENRMYVKVIDYKSGDTKFDLLKLYHGLQLQLVVYMNAAMELKKKSQLGKDVIPGGMFYYHIDDPVIEVSEEQSEDEIKDAILKSLRLDGVVNKEPDIYRAMDMDFEKKSDVIPVEETKSGISARSSVLSTEEFEVVSEYARQKIIQSGEEIFGGNIEISPKMDANGGACKYCPYTAICGFDVKIDGYQEKKISKMDKEVLLLQMETDNAISRNRKN